MLDNIGDKMVIIYFFLILLVMMYMYKVCILFIVMECGNVISWVIKDLRVMKS